MNPPPDHTLREEIAKILFDTDGWIGPYDEQDATLDAILEAVRQRIPSKKKKQFPLHKDVLKRVYDSDVVSYNQAIDDILEELK